MLLQPDSKLFIVPFEGGKAKPLGCNLSLMNSWHSWSPNSNWIVFSSKGLSIYTDLFLSHINENGEASAPILVEKARDARKVVNYPEFVNRKPSSYFTMNYDYVEISNIFRSFKNGEKKKAIELFHRFQNQNEILIDEDYYQLSYVLNQMGLKKEADKYLNLIKKK